MSAWPEAIYIIRKIESALEASLDIETIVTALEQRRTIIANNISSDPSNPVPEGHSESFSPGAFWVITG